MALTVTLAGETLNVKSITASAQPVAVEWDSWENGTYKRKYVSFGHIRRWALICYEKDIDWTNSSYQTLEQKLKTGEKVNFTVSDSQIYNINTTVYITSLELTLEPKGSNIREFRIEIQEA